MADVWLVPMTIAYFFYNLKTIKMSDVIVSVNGLDIKKNSLYKIVDKADKFLYGNG